MVKKTLQHLGQVLITLIGVTFLTFSLSFLAPGDPVLMLLETADTIVSQELIDQTRQDLGLDQPFLVQYGHWLIHAVQGDLGMSYSAKKPVVDKMMEALPGTLMLAGVTIVMILAMAVPLGIIAALYQNKWPDFLIRGIAFIGISLPAFWLGLMLLYIFGYKLGIAPIATATVSLKNAILPAFTLAFALMSKFMRQVRLVILEEINKDYAVGARARGMGHMEIMFCHILPNAFLPLLTIFGMSMGWLLGGVAVVEMVFSWPGLGKMAVQAITFRDYPLIEGFVLWASIAYMLINGIIDYSYTILDPRLKRGSK